MSNAKPPRMRPDETGKHVRTESPVDRPAQSLDIEKLDRQRSEGEDDDDRHEKRPEGPYKDPADEEEQGEVK